MGLVSGTIALLGFSALGAGGPTAFVAIDIHGRSLWENYVSDAESRGQPLQLEQVYERPPIANADNFANAAIFRAVSDAHANGLPHPDWFSVKGIEGIEQQRLPKEAMGGRELCTLLPLAQWIPKNANPENESEYILDKLDTVRADLDAFVESSKRKHCRFPVKWDDGFAAHSPHTGSLLAAKVTLGVRANAQLKARKLDDSLASTEALLRITHHLRNEPALISSLVRILYHQAALESIWDGLNQNLWRKEHLASLESLLAKLEFDQSFEKTMRSEQVLAAQSFIRFSKGEFPAELFSLIGSNAEFWVVRLPEGGWLEAAWAHSYLMDLACFSQPTYSGCLIHKPNDRAITETVEKWRRPLLTPGRIMASVSVPAFGSISRKALKAEADLRLARIAIALERAKLANGNYPAELQDLIPAFLPELPVDPISGKPFHYRLRGDRPAIWSNGLNETNQGGRPKKNLERGDWCWQYSLPGGYDAEDYFSDDEIKLP